MSELEQVFQELNKKLTMGVSENELERFFIANKDYFAVNVETYKKILYESGTVAINNEGLIVKK